MDFSTDEAAVFSNFQSYIFPKSVVEVSAEGAPFRIILVPHAIDTVSGSIRG